MYVPVIILFYFHCEVLQDLLHLVMTELSFALVIAKFL